MSEQPAILIFISHYLPGYLSGGPVRSISNLVSTLSSAYRFHIVTRAHDFGCTHKYDVPLNQWTTVGTSQVFYSTIPIASSILSSFSARRIKPRFLYLNSFFNPFFTLLPLICYRLSFFPSVRKLIIAPRGELMEGALCHKSFRKSIYILFIKSFRLLNSNSIIFHATSTQEVTSICDSLRLPQSRCLYAPNITSSHESPLETGVPCIDEFSICFFSRITPKKNLHYALDILRQLTIPLVFTVYGPIEDKSYWDFCLLGVGRLPPNISFIYGGPLHPDQVHYSLSQHHLFFLPTLGENFGHVIHEALTSGLPCLLSDQTPWSATASSDVTWSYPLASPDLFIKKIETLYFLRSSLYPQIRHRSVALSQQFSSVNSTLYYSLFS